MPLTFFFLRHRTTHAYLSMEGHPIPPVKDKAGNEQPPSEARRFTAWLRAEAYRDRYLESFAGSWEIVPLIDAVTRRPPLDPESPTPDRAA